MGRFLPLRYSVGGVLMFSSTMVGVVERVCPVGIGRGSTTVVMLGFGIYQFELS
jgi:hypothetical protein